MFLGFGFIFVKAFISFTGKDKLSYLLHIYSPFNKNILGDRPVRLINVLTKMFLNLRIYIITNRKEALSMTKVKESKNSKKLRPPLTPEARENQMISLAVDLAEQQLRDGTASSQVITHFLKLGTTKAELEKEKLKEENKLLRARTESLESAKDTKILYEEALKAMRNYAGNGDPDEY